MINVPLPNSVGGAAPVQKEGQNAVQQSQRALTAVGQELKPMMRSLMKPNSQDRVAGLGDAPGSRYLSDQAGAENAGHEQAPVRQAPK
ncbi:hypothetical protein MRX96_029997 [Rhipicephalus microplus]